jgi:hypothetical protein
MHAIGHLKVHAPWTFGVNTSSVKVTARFGLWPGSSSTPYATELFGSVRTLGSTLTGGDTRAIWVNGATALSRTLLSVPPGQGVVFETALAVEYENDEGNIEADFESGDFKFTSNFVQLVLENWLLNPPKGVMA